MRDKVREGQRKNSGREKRERQRWGRITEGNCQPGSGKEPRKDAHLPAGLSSEAFFFFSFSCTFVFTLLPLVVHWKITEALLLPNVVDVPG